MKKYRLAAGLALAGFGLTVAMQAQTLKQDPKATVTFFNAADNAVWITMYRGEQHSGKLAYGCAVPGKSLNLVGGATIVSQLHYHLLLEVKASKTDCSNGSNVYTKDLYYIEQTSIYLRKDGSGKIILSKN